MIQPRTNRPFLAAFTTVFSCVRRRDSTAAARQWLIGASTGATHACMLHTRCVLRKSYLLLEKMADQVVSGLKLKLQKYGFLEEDLKTGW